MTSKQMTHTSRCGDMEVKGTRAEIIRKYEGMAFGAERAGDHVMANVYRQHAEGWKRDGKK